VSTESEFNNLFFEKKTADSFAMWRALIEKRIKILQNYKEKKEKQTRASEFNSRRQRAPIGRRRKSCVETACLPTIPRLAVTNRGDGIEC
jgi:hypothetical protein